MISLRRYLLNLVLKKGKDLDRSGKATTEQETARLMSQRCAYTECKVEEK